MIFIGFIGITGILLLFAHFSGNVGYFINLDSIPLVIVPGILFSLCCFKWREYIDGIKTVFSFRVKSIKQDNKTAAHYKSLIYITNAFGILSTIQGLFSYILDKRDYALGLTESSEFALRTTFAQASVYASFSTAYALLLSAFLLYPVYILKKEEVTR
ncbi:MAG: hypothetical protein LBU99_03955 [Spirochaetaceae bacterium]|jgi:hypothetical protein|nr:hypothetical protein [Spirochaetaceae bacterium]